MSAFFEQERGASLAVFELADALQDLLHYSRVELPLSTRTVLTKEYRALRSVCEYYGTGATLEFNPLPGTPFKKVARQPR